MKASEAPEKIILSADRDTQIINDEWVINDYTDNIKIEYIRVDAFVEKARKWFEEHADDYNYTWYNEMEGESGITIECIEDFINYMKGE
jgi:hypothetical protein